MRWIALCTALVCAAPAAAQQWFHHDFGELRAYHGDYLSVCNDNGAGACRTVQTGMNPSDFLFDERLVLHRREDAPGWVVEVMVRGMPDALSSLAFSIDGETVDVPLAHRAAGGYDFANVAETVHITDAALNNELVRRMRAGNKMTVYWTPRGDSDGSEAFSLRGVTAATNAIDARVRTRQ